MLIETSASTASSWKRSRTSRAARAAPAEAQRLASCVLDQRVSAGERPVRVVRGEGEREALQIAGAGGVVGGARAVGGAGQGGDVRGGALAAGGDTAARAGSQLAQQLVQAPALTRHVMAGGGGQALERAGAIGDRAPAVSVQAAGAPAQVRMGGPAVDRDRRLRGVGGGRAGHGGDVVDQGAVGVVADR